VDAPISVGVILDVSGSMGTKIEKAREAVVALLQASNPEDEFFLMTFADTPTLAHDFTQDINELQSALLLTRPKGRTCLLDAIYLAVQKMTKARYSRAALVIVSDGGDNQSRYTEKDVKSLVKEANVLVYSIGIFDREFATREELLGPQLLSESARLLARLLLFSTVRTNSQGS
jgi:Ca-activated chloride channel family protein